MNRFATVLGFAVLAGAAALISVHAADVSPTPATKPSTQPVAVNQFCPIEPENKIDPMAETYLYKGKVIGFCCPSCIEDFKKDPEKYMAILK